MILSKTRHPKYNLLINSKNVIKNVIRVWWCENSGVNHRQKTEF